MPSIPVMPIGYDDAEKIFRAMDGTVVPWTRWTGNIPVEYKLNSTVKFRLDVHTKPFEATIKNVVATFTGRESADDWILLSNHVDAWGYGGIDPNTGTAILLEMARVFKKVNMLTGWRPRRTIKFCQWDAEEFGLIGSTEFVEEFQKLLSNRAVVLLNVDNVNGNNTLTVKSVPLLYRSLTKAAHKIKHPNKEEINIGHETLLDSWKFYGGRGAIQGDRSIPNFGHPVYGSDFQPFLGFLGVPSADFKMESAPQYSYMLYHTVHETSWTVKNLIDPTGKVLRAMARFWSEVARDLSDSQVGGIRLL